MFFEIIFNEPVGFIKMNRNLFIFFILKVNPFMFKDLQVLNFLLNHVSFEHCLVDDGQGSGDSKAVYDGFFEGANSTEKKIAFVKRNVLNIGIGMEININNVIALCNFEFKKVISIFRSLHFC
jgi:hypothetical protein